MTDNSTDRVEVTQSDREAAASIASIVRDQAFNSLYVCEGRCDDHHVVQAFACHRLAALSGAGGGRPTQDDIYSAFYAESAVLDEARAGAQVLTVAQFGAAVHRLLATHPGDHPGDAGEGLPDIGVDPLKLSRPDDRYEASRLRLREAYVKQQAGVPDQTALVWRYDLGTVLEMALRLQVLLKRDTPTSAPAGDRARREVLEAVVKPVILACTDDEGFDDHDHWAGLVARRVVANILAFSTQATDREKVLGEAGWPSFRAMSEWDCRDEAVLLLVDYREDGEHALDDATIAVTIGHNNDHNVGDDEGQGWRFAGWCWSHDHYVEGKGKPIGWLPLPHAVGRAIEDAADIRALAQAPSEAGR